MLDELARFMDDEDLYEILMRELPPTSHLLVWITLPVILQLFSEYGTSSSAGRVSDCGTFDRDVPG